MGKTLIKVNCVDQRLFISAGPTIASGGRNEDEIEFNFCQLWDGFEKTAVFFRDKSAVYHIPIADDKCVIPHEVLSSEGWLYFGVFGVKDDLRRTSEIMKYHIVKGAITEGGLPTDPTTDVYKRYLDSLAKMEQVTADVEAAETERKKQIDQLSEEIASIKVDPENKNLIDWDTCTPGYIMLNTGSLFAEDIGWVTDFIKCTPSQSYVYSLSVNLGVLYIASVAFFDAEKAFVSYITNVYTYTAPENAAYMRLSVRYQSASGSGSSSGITADTIEDGADYRWRKTMLQIGAEPSEVGDTTLDPDIKITDENLSNNVKESLYKHTWYFEKKIVVYGDSIVEHNKWQPHVAEYLGCTTYNQGVGGTTVYNNGATATVPQGTIDGWMCGDARINRIGTSYADFDAIIILAGHNDCGEHVDIGEVTSPFSDATFKSAYALMLQKMQAKYSVPIICMTLLGGRLATAGTAQDMPWTNADGLTMRNYSEAILDVCAMYGIPCIDLNATCGINTWNAPEYLSDTVHPNDAGGARMAQAIISGLLAVEPRD